MKYVMIADNLTRPAQTRVTQNGDPMTVWTVAVSDRRTPNAPPMFFDCSLFGKRGEALAPYLLTGTPVTVTGELSTREHQGKTYLQVRVADLTLMGGGRRDDRDDAPPRVAAARQDARQPAHTPIDDEIPF